MKIWTTIRIYQILVLSPWIPQNGHDTLLGYIMIETHNSESQV